MALTHHCRKRLQIRAFRGCALTSNDLIARLIEQISFEARSSEFVDQKSGVSARLTIAALENAFSAAERRALINKEKSTQIWMSDLQGVIQAITGKIELVYEGEQEGAAIVAQHLIGDSIHTFFPAYFPKIEKLEKPGERTVYTDILDWFFTESGFELLDDCSDEEYKRILDSVTPLEILIKKYQPQLEKKDSYFMKEFILWALVEYKKLSKDRLSEGYQFKDIYGSYISKL